MSGATRSAPDPDADPDVDAGAGADVGADVGVGEGADVDAGASARRRRWQRVQSLFHRARELDASERGEFVERHCAGDPELAREVGELLAEALTSHADSLGARRSAREDLTGRRLGDHELVRIVGEGSMGVIYEARQGSVQRSVALKILRERGEVLRSGGSPEAYERMAARFLDEAEVLGLLDHPGIVPLHDLQKDAAGRSWFTMRLVQGEDFRSIVDRVHAGTGGWTLHRALHVVARVCETMAFAHRRGVLHRDLKPSHVMVGGFGEVYIVDWGLSKLLSRHESRDIRIREQELRAEADGEGAVGADPTPLRTVDGDVIGTPAYMPPEQAHGKVDLVEERSDVYAVGALLHHLLTGQIPHLRPGERGVAPREILARVRRGPPPPVHAFHPHVPPALAAVCDKAMAREIEQRYASMEALAEDLHAFLENRVVAAHRTGPLVELGKWVQRNRGLAASFTGIALAVLLGVAAVLTVQSRSNARLADTNADLAAANERVERERDAAALQAAIASEVGGFLDRTLRSVDPFLAQGEAVTVRDALDAASERLEGAFQERPLVEAALRTTVGVTYRQLGLTSEAEPHLRRALALRETELGADAAETLLALEELAILLRDQGRLDEAEPLLRRAAAGRGGGSADAYGDAPRAALRSRGNLAQLLLDDQRIDEADALAREVLAEQERALGPEDPDVLVSLEVLASVAYRRGETEEAEGLFRRLLEQNARVHGDDHPNTLISALNLVSLLDASGRGQEAALECERYVERATDVFGAEHRNTLIASANLALLLCQQGREDEGFERFGATLVREREVFGSEHPETMMTLFNYAETLRRARRQTQSLPLFTELLEWQREHLPRAHQDRRDTLWGLADALLAEGRAGEAEPLLAELLETELDVSGPEHPKTEAVRARLDECRARVAAATSAARE